MPQIDIDQTGNASWATTADRLQRMFAELLVGKPTSIERLDPTDNESWATTANKINRMLSAAGSAHRIDPTGNTARNVSISRIETAMAVLYAGGTPTPTPTPTPIGDRTVVMSQRIAPLPDGLYPSAAGVGYPCTGLALDRTDGTFWGGHGTASLESTAGIVHLSPDLSTILGQFTVGSMGLPAGSVQGVDVDPADGTLWFVLKVPGTEAHIVNCTKAGVKIRSSVVGSTWNGLAVDSKRDALVLLREAGDAFWFSKPADGGALTGTGKASLLVSTNAPDMLHYDPLRDELLATHGANNAAGFVRVYDVSADNVAPVLRSTLTLDQAFAIEGVVRRGDDLIVVSDQHTHPVTGQTTNQAQVYANAMVVPVTPPVFAFAANPVALEGDVATFTLNVTRNGTDGALSGTFAVSGITADAADFGGTFPSGTWTIPSGQNSTTIAITSSEDTDPEGDQTYTLTASRSGTVVATATGTIGEDDAAQGSYAPESTALFARMTNQPSEARKTAINNLIVALKTAGVFAQADAIYVPAAHDAQAATLDWTADRTLVLSGTAPSFTVDRGYTTNGTSSFLHLNLTPAATTKFLQDSASMLMWSNRTALGTSTATAAMGTLATTNIIALAPTNTGGNIAALANSATASVGSVFADSKGLFGWSRTGASAGKMYRNGQPAGDITSASASLSAQTGFFSSGRRGSSTYTPAQGAFYLVGGAFNDAQHTAIYNAVSTYMTAVGNT